MSFDFKDQHMILAVEIVNNPKMVDEIRGRYQTIYDQALASLKFDNLDRAIKIMAEKGWKPISMAGFTTISPLTGAGAFYMYALLQRPGET